MAVNVLTCYAGMTNFRAINKVMNKNATRYTAHFEFEPLSASVLANLFHRYLKHHQSSVIQAK